MTADRNTPADAILADLSASVRMTVASVLPRLREGGVMGKVRVSWRSGWAYCAVTVTVHQSFGDSLAQDARQCRGTLETALRRAGYVVENVQGDLRVYPAMSKAA